MTIGIAKRSIDAWLAAGFDEEGLNQGRKLGIW